MAIDIRAHRAQLGQASPKNPGAIAQYSGFLNAEIAVQRTSFEGTRLILTDNLAAGDDAAVHRTLTCLFPPRWHLPATT